MNKKTWIGMSGILLLFILLPLACSDAEDYLHETGDDPNKTADGDDSTSNGGTPLDFGDASWEKPDFTPPGGERSGDNGNEDPYGEGDETWSGLADGDAPPPDGEVEYTCTSDSDCGAGEICDSGQCIPDPCPDYEPCAAPAWCDEDTAYMTVCTLVEDPEHPGCQMPKEEQIACPGGTRCEEPDGDVDCYAIEDPERSARLDCPVEREPVVLYMSNDDSNSMASPIFARAIIREGGIVYPNQVRIYEFLNYYSLAYDNPADKPAAVGLQMRRTDADSGEFTLLLYAQGRKIDPAERRPINIVFSLDTSGSMSGHPIEMVREICRATASSLKEGDVVSIVEWSSSQSVILDGYQVQQPNDPHLLSIINGLDSGGSTDLHGGLVRAYELARDNFNPNRINRVVLISDGGANTGITDIDLIAAEADDSNGEGIYMVGVGVDENAFYFNEDLMNEITDAGKGAYLYVDTAEEARRMFGDPQRFLSNLEVAARDVRMELTLPWYFGMKEFHGEEYSENPEEVEPQHLSPNDAMSYHQIVQTCDPSLAMVEDTIKARVDYQDPITRAAMSDEIEMTLGDAVTADATQLRKADVIVTYAKALIVIGYLVKSSEFEGAYETALGLAAWLRIAAEDLGNDAEVLEIANLMEEYRDHLATSYSLDGDVDGDASLPGE